MEIQQTHDIQSRHMNMNEIRVRNLGIPKWRNTIDGTKALDIT